MHVQIALSLTNLLFDFLQFYVFFFTGKNLLIVIFQTLDSYTITRENSL